MDRAVTLERYAEARAEMEAGSRRDEVLARAGLTIDAWTAIQREWLEKMGAELERGRFELTNRYTRAFNERQRALAEGTLPALEAPASPAAIEPQPRLPAPAAIEPQPRLPAPAAIEPVAPIAPVAPAARSPELEDSVAPSLPPDTQPPPGDQTLGPGHMSLRAAMPFQPGAPDPLVSRPVAPRPVAPRPVVPRPAAKVDTQPLLPLDMLDEQPVDQTFPPGTTPLRPAIPFKPSSPEKRGQAVEPRPPPQAPGQTTAEMPYPLDPEATLYASSALIKAALPFERRPPRPPPPAPPPPPEKAARASAPDLSSLAPRAAAPAPALALEQYASLHVELDLYPQRRAETLLRYFVSEAQLAELDATYGARIAADPQLRVAWDAAYTSYRSWLVASQEHRPG